MTSDHQKSMNVKEVKRELHIGRRYFSIHIRGKGLINIQKIKIK